MSLNNSIVTQSIGVPYQQYVTSSAGHTLVSSSTYFNDTSDNLPRYKDANGLIYDPFITSSYAITASHALNAGGGGSTFPFTGDAEITGSLIVSGSSNKLDISLGENVFVGKESGRDQTDNRFSVFLGSRAGLTNSTGNQNIGIGYGAGGGIGTAGTDGNVFIGSLAGAGNASISSITARMSNADNNVGIGYQALLYLTSGQYNIAIGSTAMRGSGAAMSSIDNIALGRAALYKTDSGDSNIGIGVYAGLNQTTGDGNITIGSGSLGVAGESNQLRIGNGNSLVTISGSLATGDIIFPSTASAAYFSGDGSQLTNLPAGTTPSLQQVTDQGATTTNDITASANISLPTNASSIRFNDAELHGRTGGSYPGLTIASGDSANARIWISDTYGATGPPTMSFVGLGKITGVQTIESQGNWPLIIRGGAGPNDANDGVQMFTGDASNVYQQRFAIEADGANVDAYFHNINGLGINDTTPSATLDVNGNINTTSHITASGNVSSSATSTASFGTYLGDGSQLTNLPASSTFPFTGDAQITGSLTISGSSENLISGSFKVVSPTRGTMFNIDANTFTLGPGASAGGGYTAVAIGHNASTGNNYSVSIGSGATTNSNLYAVAIGGAAVSANGAGAVCIGGNGCTAGAYGISMGYQAAGSGDNSINLGRKSRGTGDNSVTFNTSGDIIAAPSNTRAFNVFLSDGTGNPDFVISASNESKISGSSFTVEKSGSTVFDVIGSVGTLFSVDDDLSGTLFTANDITGLPVLEASASGEVYIGKSPQSLYTTAVISATSASKTESIYSMSTSSYDGAFFDYTAVSASNARSGNIMSIWNGGSVSYTETTTADIGDTTGLTFFVDISESKAQLFTVSATNNSDWKVKTIIKAI